MTLTSYPLADKFTTTLSQQYNGTDTTIYVSAVPNITRPSGITTYLVLNPGNSLQQVVKISGMDAIGKTFTVSSTTIASGAGTNYTTNTHSIGDVVIISDNYAFRKDIKDAIDTKLSTNGGTRTGLTAHRLLYTDGSGVETQLAFGTNGQVLGFNGLTSAPAPVSPSVDINGLTNDDTNPTANDKIVRYKDGTGNVKRSMIASETAMGLVERATDAEAIAGTDTTRYVTPKQVKDNYDIAPTAGSINVGATGNTTRTTTSTSYVKLKAATANKNGGYQVNFERTITVGGATLDWEVRVGGVMQQSGSSNNTSWIAVNTNVTATATQEISLRIKVQIGGYTGSVRNFNISYNLPQNTYTTLTQD